MCSINYMVKMLHTASDANVEIETWRFATLLYCWSDTHISRRNISHLRDSFHGLPTSSSTTHSEKPKEDVTPPFLS